MNKLNTQERARIISCLAEGCSLRATVRLTGFSRKGVSAVMVDVGKACLEYHDKVMRNLTCKTIQVDEVWSFTYCKRANIPENLKGKSGIGDTWTWIAIDADTKLIPSWYVGDRTTDSAEQFLNDLKERLANRVQLTTDGHKPYLEAVEGAFGSEVDYAMLIKIFGRSHDSDNRYSPPKCIGVRRRTITGKPDRKLVSNTQELIHFINITSTGSGGDADEAVEDALNDLNQNMNWKESNARSVVIFGDASPHPSAQCPHRHDFFNLTRELFQNGVTINSVYYAKFPQVDLQKLENVKVGDFSSKKTHLPPPNFFSWIGNVTGGMVIGVESIDDLVDIIKASAAKDSGHLDELEKKMKKTSPSKLKLIEVARMAEQRKKLGGDQTKMLKY